MSLLGAAFHQIRYAKRYSYLAQKVRNSLAAVCDQLDGPMGESLDESVDFLTDVIIQQVITKRPKTFKKANRITKQIFTKAVSYMV